MPFLFMIVGIVMVVASVRGTNDDLANLLRKDFMGPNNFIYWSFAILLLGALGYIRAIQPATRMFMVLVVVALFISNKGVFANLQKALGQTQTLQPDTTASINPSSIGAGLGLGGTLGQQIAGLGTINSQIA